MAPKHEQSPNSGHQLGVATLPEIPELACLFWCSRPVAARSCHDPFSVIPFWA